MCLSIIMLTPWVVSDQIDSHCQGSVLLDRPSLKQLLSLGEQCEQGHVQGQQQPGGQYEDKLNIFYHDIEVLTVSLF